TLFRSGPFPRAPLPRVGCIRPVSGLATSSGCSSGIEPLFALTYTRHILDGANFLEVNPYFSETARSGGFYSEDLMQKLAGGSHLVDINGVPDKYKRLFVTAHDIGVDWHVKMQAAFQRHTDNAVSKTVNFSREATPEDVSRVYQMANEEGLKGITIYRDGSREGQVLTTGAAGEKPVEAPKSVAPSPRRRTRVTTGATERVELSFPIQDRPLVNGLCNIASLDAVQRYCIPGSWFRRIIACQCSHFPDRDSCCDLDHPAEENNSSLIMSNQSSILSIRNADFGYISKSRSLSLLKDVNLDIKRNELVGLIGRNGSGKSTMLRTLVNIHELLKGGIEFNGRSMKTYSRAEFARMVAFVSASIPGVEGMSLEELVSLGRFPYTNWIGNLTDEDHEIIDRAMQLVGITQLANRKLNEVSDGERQKAMIARTLAQDTTVIILDEPTAFLDLPSKYDLIDLLHLLTAQGRTVIYSTHDLNIALKFSDRIWIIDEGAIYDGAPEDMILNNTFAKIFGSEKISFNPAFGEFELKRNLKKWVSLRGDDQICLNWTDR
ncbi:MAG: ATP-binding cassette domain-containing protein, partial [Bacteroidales bacterium]|nr:ATP-binding cassette domain-containing protein [Bacteroidales bacterium]